MRVERASDTRGAIRVWGLPARQVPSASLLVEVYTPGREAGFDAGEAELADVMAKKSARAAAPDSAGPHSPRHCGARFARNAATPSRKSVLP